MLQKKHGKNMKIYMETEKIELITLNIDGIRIDQVIQTIIQ